MHGQLRQTEGRIILMVGQVQEMGLEMKEGERRVPTVQRSCRHRVSSCRTASSLASGRDVAKPGRSHDACGCISEVYYWTKEEADYGSLKSHCGNIEWRCY